MAIDVDKWIEIAKECNYLPENDLKVFYSCYIEFMFMFMFMFIHFKIPTYNRLYKYIL